MIRELSFVDIDCIYDIINAAAGSYQGIIPSDCYHEPYMPKEELKREMNSMTFFGWEERRRLVGIMGFQPVKDVTLIRHAYVLPERQGKGIGTRLLDHLKRMTTTSQLLDRKQGFKLMPDKDGLLMRFWNIPRRQIETSVVLGIDL